MKISNIKSLYSARAYISYVGIFIFIFTILYFPYLANQKIYIFTYPNSDNLILYWPYKQNILSIIKNHQLFDSLFLLSSALGNNIFGIKATVLDPFNLFFIIKNSSFLIIWQNLIKLLIIFIMTYKILFLRTKSNHMSFIFSLIFAFNGMFTFWSTQDFHLTAMVFIIMQWYGYELYRSSGRSFYFILFSLPLFMLSTIYWVIVFNLFFIIYIILDNAWNKNTSNSDRPVNLGHVVIIYLCVILISAWSILPEIWVLSHITRVSGINAVGDFFHKKLFTQFGIIEPLQLYDLRLYAQFILRGFGNYTIPYDKVWVSSFSGPLWYSSTFLLISAFAYICSSITKSRKVLFNTLIIVGILLLLFPFVTLIFNGMSDVRVRWSWFLLIPLSICATKFWSYKPNLASFRISLILLTIIFILSAIYSHHVGDLYFGNKYVLYTYIEIIVCLSLFYLLSFIGRYAVGGMVVIAILDVLFQNYTFISTAIPINPNYATTQKYYYDNTIKAINLIKQEDHELFYRVDKSYSSLNLCEFCGLNENLIQGYFGVKGYLSAINPAYFNFSQDMGSKPYYNFIFGFDKRYNVLQMLSVKYILTKQIENIANYHLYKKVDDINIYIANNYTGIGHIFHNYILRNEFMKFDNQSKDTIFSRCLVMQDAKNPVIKYNTNSSDCIGLTSVLDKADESFNLQELAGNKIIGIANLKTPGVLFLAIPFDEGFSARVDGNYQPLLKVNNGFLGLALTKGQHHIEIRYMPPLLKAGLIISAITFILLLCLIIYNLRYSTFRSNKILI